jgi:hypothetical protein
MATEQFIPVHSKVLDEVLDFLLSSPTVHQIAEFHLSDESDTRVEYLLEANRKGTLTPEERAEIEEYLRLEHFVRMLKIRAYAKLRKP